MVKRSGYLSGSLSERIETQVLEPLEAKLREVFEVRRLVSQLQMASV